MLKTDVTAVSSSFRTLEQLRWPLRTTSRSQQFQSGSDFRGCLLCTRSCPLKTSTMQMILCLRAAQIARLGHLINSQHLYLDAMRWLYLHLHDAGLTISPVTLLALYSAVWGAIGLAILYRLLVRAGLGNLALSGALFSAFSADYWSYSIVGDVYIPLISLMIIGLYFIYLGITSENARSAWLNAIGATIAFLAMLAHHQAFILLVLGFVPAAFLMRQGVVRKWRVLFGVGVPAAVSVLAFLLWTVVYYSTPVKEQHGLVRFGMGYVASFQNHPDQKHLDLRPWLVSGQVRFVHWLVPM